MATFHKFFYAMPRRTPTQGVCAYLLTPGGEPAAFRPDHQLLALSEEVHPVWAYVTSVYRAP